MFPRCFIRVSVALVLLAGLGGCATTNQVVDRVQRYSGHEPSAAVRTVYVTKPAPSTEAPGPTTASTNVRTPESTARTPDVTSRSYTQSYPAPRVSYPPRQKTVPSWVQVARPAPNPPAPRPIERPPSPAREPVPVTRSDAPESSRNFSASPPGIRSTERSFVIRYTETGRLAPLWRLYRAFEYAAVIDAALEIDSPYGLSPEERSACWALAGVSAYLLWRSEEAETYLRRSVEMCSRAELDPTVFPQDVCGIYEQYKRRTGGGE